MVRWLASVHSFLGLVCFGRVGHRFAGRYPNVRIASLSSAATAAAALASAVAADSCSLSAGSSWSSAFL